MTPGVEFSDLNWLGLGLAALVSIILGFLWFSPKTPMGRIWMRGMGMDPANMPKVQAGKMVQSMAIMLVGTFFLWFVFAHTNVAYDDAYDKDCAADSTQSLCDGKADYDLTVLDGVMGGLFTWLGFFLPLNLGAVAWENKSWGYALNTTAYYLIQLVVGGILLVTVGY